LSKFLIIILAISMCFSACRKDVIVPVEACIIQTANPDHQSYSANDFSATNYSGKHCGLMPLSSKHYWVYLDSIFDNGSFVATKYDTLRFSKTYQTQPDGLTWWEANKFVGLPSKCYANDSSIFGLDYRLFTSNTILDVRKELYQFSQDSLRYITSFGDEAALGRALHCNFQTSVATFTNCLFFEKYARMYRRDQVYLQPGLGVVKYIHEEAPLGSLEIQTQQISTLVSFNIQ
jgi:hypothetical protein